MQIYPSKSQTEQLDVDRPATPEPAEMVRELVQAAAGAYVSGVDWSAVERARNERTGVPIRVATRLSVLRDRVPAHARETLHDDREPIRFEREPAETYVPYDEHQTLGPDQPDGDRDNTNPGRSGTVDRQRAAFSISY